MRFLFSVLHPHHKLAYFEAAGWDQAWIDTARDLVREQFELQYTTLPTTASTRDRPSNLGDKQGDSTMKSMVSHNTYFL
jgi:hypothetical protein